MEQSQVSLEKVYEKLIKLEKFMQKMDEYMSDLEFARQTNEAWQEIETGNGITLTKEEFLKELESW